ncbi:hypothetical protein NHQ30_008953 [Ciborinia camelliae]|nr:hypothetical protein NHQ30_008953 [Ciborinia camelliae]
MNRRELDVNGDFTFLSLDGMLHKPGAKGTNYNFGFYEATHSQDIPPSKLKEIIHDARRKNPEGVMIAGLKVDNMAHIAGYLNFENTAVLVKWFEDKDQLPTVLDTWRRQKLTAFGCSVRDGAKPADKEFGAEKLFRFIKALTPEQTNAVIGSQFPVTHAMLNVNISRDDLGFFSYLNAMHRVICTFADHFPNDTPTMPTEIHSRENWYRALITLRVYWATHRDLKVRAKALSPKPAIKPLWVEPDNGRADLEVDENLGYSVYKQTEYNDMYNLENEQSVTGSDFDSARMENDNVAEAEGLHQSLNKTGIVYKEASQRTGQPGKKERPHVRPEELKGYFAGLGEFMKRWVVETREVQGPAKENASEHPFLRKTMEFGDILDTVQELSKAEISDFENGKKKFFDLLEKMSSASAKPMSFVDSCKAHGIDYSDPHNIKIEGTTLKPYPHQVIDMAWLAWMEDTFFGGGILASECGSGKTVVILLLILMTHRKLKATGSTEHFATLVVVPSAVIDVWYADFAKFFADVLTCRIFYGRSGNPDANREKCFVGTNIKDLEAELKELDPTNPDTSKTFFLTSYTTFARRSMKIIEASKAKGKAASANYMSDQEEVDPIVDPMADQDDQILRKYEQTLNHYGILGRVIPDEGHLIKNPCTLAADSIYKLQIKRTNLVSATPMINRIHDFRGFLIQLLKVKELPLNLPVTLGGLVSMYKECFHPFNDLPKEEGGIKAKSILPPRTDGPEVERLYQAIEAGCPLHLLCPKAFLFIGSKSDWEAPVARAVLRPILQRVQRRRLMSHTFETIDGEMETPGRAIPHYTVKTIRLRMSEKQKQHYRNMTGEWERKLYVPSNVGVPFTSVKMANSKSDGMVNMEAYRGLQLSSFDGQLTELVTRKVKEVPVGTSKEVRSWYERDDDHGMTYKYYRTRPKEAYYIPAPSTRLEMATTHMGLSPKLRALVLQIAEWKSKGERCLAFFNWPMSQWDAEGLLHMLGFKVMSILSSHKAEDRRRAIDLFNDQNHDVDVMLVGFRIGSYGLNFHSACCKMIICEYPTSIDVLLHVFGRLHRLGQLKAQEIIILFLEDSFDAKIRGNMAEKFLSKLVAEGEFEGVDEDKMVEEARKVLSNLLGESD